MLRLPLPAVRPAVRLLNAAIATHLRSRERDHLSTNTVDMMAAAAATDHEAMDYPSFAAQLVRSMRHPRTPLIAPAFAAMSRHYEASDEGGSSEVSSSSKPFVVSFSVLRRLLIAIQLMPDGVAAEREELESVLLERHLVDYKSFQLVSREVEASPSGSATAGGRAPLLTLDVDKRDAAIVWGVAAQATQLHHAQVIAAAFQLSDYAIPTSSVHAKVLLQQRILSYLCHTSTLRLPQWGPPELYTTAAAAAPSSSSSVLPQLLLREMRQEEGRPAMWLLKHCLGVSTAWRWCAEAFSLLQSDQQQHQPAASSSDDRSSSLSKHSRSGTRHGSSSAGVGSGSSEEPLSVLRPGSLYTTALLLSSMTQHWPENILPAELLAVDAGAIAAFGAPPFVISDYQLVFEFSAALTESFYPPRVKDALTAVLRQTFWVCHTYQPISMLVNFYLLSVHGRFCSSSSTAPAAISEKDTRVWAAWVEHHQWLLSTLLKPGQPASTSASTVSSDPAAPLRVLPTILSALLSGVTLWARDTTAVSVEELLMPYLRRLTHHHLPSTSSGAASQWGSTELLVITAVLQRLLLTPAASLFQYGEELVPLLEFVEAAFTAAATAGGPAETAKIPQPVLIEPESASARDLAVAILWCSELLDSDVAQVITQLKAAAAQARSSTQTGILLRPVTATTMTPLQSVLHRCWQAVAKGTRSGMALPLPLLHSLQRQAATRYGPDHDITQSLQKAPQVIRSHMPMHLGSL